jgi:hypothetical protein
VTVDEKQFFPFMGITSFFFLVLFGLTGL